MTYEELMAAIAANPESAAQLVREARPLQNFTPDQVMDLGSRLIDLGQGEVAGTLDQDPREWYVPGRNARATAVESTDASGRAAATSSSIAARAGEFEAAGATKFEARSQALAEAGVEAGSEQDPFDYILPPEVVRMIGVDAVDQQAADDLLDFINQAQGATYTSVEAAFEGGAFQDPTVAAASRFLAAPEEPEGGMVISTVKGQDRVFLTNTEANQAMEIWGLRPHELDRTVKLADMYGFKNLDGSTAWQSMAALFKAAGYAGYGNTAEQDRKLKQEKDSLAIEIQRMKDRLKGMNPGGEGGMALKKQIDEAQAEYDGLTKRYTENVVKQPTSAKNPMWTPQYLRQQYMAGIETYEGDDRLALIHVFNPALASRIKASGGDPSKLAWQDAEQLGSITRAAGFTSLDEFASTMVAFGMGEAGGYDMMSQLLKSMEAMLNAGGGGRTVMKPDPVAIRQATEDMYRSLYLEDPTDEQLNAMAAKVEAAIVGAPDDQNVDGNARVRDVVESDPMYQKYYGNKPGGMSEEEYQGMHRAAQSSMLGEELAGNAAVRLGMQEGSYQTTVGATMGMKEAWDNSTFLGRLAQASNSFARMT